MRKYPLILLGIIILSVPIFAFGQQPIQKNTTCDALPGFGAPITKSHTTLICRRAYVVGYNGFAKIPQWVAYGLRPNHAVGCEPRTNRFTIDSTLSPDARSTTGDYAKSGYDSGHMADAADMAWDPVVQAESFILSNVAPQTPNLNRGAWKLLETKVRAWAHSGRRLSIYIGTIWDEDPSTIGHGVVVPSRFYKVIVDDDTKEVQAFMMPNEQQVDTDLSKWATSVSDIERVGNVVLPTPGDKTKVSHIWPANIRGLLADKRATCGG